MTLGQFINEATLYPYSAEAFELQKESSEIDLMSQFIENVKISHKNVKAVTESFFQEQAINYSDLQVLVEEAEEKKNNFLQKMWAGICKFFRGIKDSILKVFGKGGKDDEHKKKSKELLDKLQNNPESVTVFKMKDAKSKKLYEDLANKAKELGLEIIKVESTRTNVLDILTKDDNSVDDDTVKGLLNYLNVIFADQSVTMKSIKPVTPNIISMPVSIQTLVTLSEEFAQLVNFQAAEGNNSPTINQAPVAKLKELNAKMYMSASEENKNGITINLADNAFTEALQKLDGIVNKFQQKATMTAGGGYEQGFFSEARTCYTTLVRLIGITNSFYMSLETYRNWGLELINSNVETSGETKDQVDASGHVTQVPNTNQAPAATSAPAPTSTTAPTTAPAPAPAG